MDGCQKALLIILEHVLCLVTHLELDMLWFMLILGVERFSTLKFGPFFWDNNLLGIKGLSALVESDSIIVV